MPAAALVIPPAIKSASICGPSLPQKRVGLRFLWKPDSLETSSVGWKHANKHVECIQHTQYKPAPMLVRNDGLALKEVPSNRP